MGGEHPGWLPEGWRVAVKIRSFGRKDKYYINPSNGLTFNSKPEVLRYLKNSERFGKLKEPNKIDIKKTVAEKLPPGWIKEVRTKKKGGKTRRDPSYIDPVSGRHFRSMQEVFRYLKSKDSGEAKAKPDDEGHKSMEFGDHSQSSSAEAKGPRLIDKKGDKNLTRHESAKSGPNVASVKNIEKLLPEQRERKDDSVVGGLRNKLPEANERQNGGRRRSMRLADSKLTDSVTEDGESLQSGSEAVAENNINIPENNGSEQREKENICTGEDEQHNNLARQNKRKNSNGKSTRELPRRTSKRLARLEVDPSMEVKTSNGAGASARMSGEGEVDTTKNVGKSEPSDEPETDATGKSARFNDSNEHHLECRTENPTNNKQKKPAAHENPSSLEERKGVGLDCKEDQKDEKHIDSPLKDLLMDPCIEFAIKTLTGAIPIEYVNKVGNSPASSLSSPNQTPASSSMLPSGDIWSDPCFEFAVKTLTGEMPTSNGSQLQISLPKFRLDAIYPSNYSFGQYDVVKKPYIMRQQGIKHPPFPQAINGSSQNSVDPSLRHGFGGRTGKSV